MASTRPVCGSSATMRAVDVRYLAQRRSCASGIGCRLQRPPVQGFDQPRHRRLGQHLAQGVFGTAPDATGPDQRRTRPESVPRPCGIQPRRSVMLSTRISAPAFVVSPRDDGKTPACRERSAAAASRLANSSARRCSLVERRLAKRTAPTVVSVIGDQAFAQCLARQSRCNRGDPGWCARRARPV